MRGGVRDIYAPGASAAGAGDGTGGAKGGSGSGVKCSSCGSPGGVKPATVLC